MAHYPYPNITLDPLDEIIQARYNVTEAFDHEGAILFVLGLLMVYAVVIMTLIISIIRRTRSDVEILDYLRDLDEIQKVNHKRKLLWNRQRSHESAAVKAPRRMPFGALSLDERTLAYTTSRQQEAYWHPYLQVYKACSPVNDTASMPALSDCRTIQKPERHRSRLRPPLVRQDAVCELDDLDFPAAIMVPVTTYSDSQSAVACLATVVSTREADSCTGGTNVTLVAPSNIGSSKSSSSTLYEEGFV